MPTCPHVRIHTCARASPQALSCTRTPAHACVHTKCMQTLYSGAHVSIHMNTAVSGHQPINSCTLRWHQAAYALLRRPLVPLHGVAQTYMCGEQTLVPLVQRRRNSHPVEGRGWRLSPREGGQPNSTNRSYPGLLDSQLPACRLLCSQRNPLAS